MGKNPANENLSLKRLIMFRFTNTTDIRDGVKQTENWQKTEGFSEQISGKINAKTGANEANLLVTGSRNHNMRTLPYSAKKGTLFDNHSHVAR